MKGHDNRIVTTPPGKRTQQLGGCQDKRRECSQVDGRDLNSTTEHTMKAARWRRVVPLNIESTSITGEPDQDDGIQHTKNPPVLSVVEAAMNHSVTKRCTQQF